MVDQKFEVVVESESGVNKPLVALSNCQVVFSDKESLDRCIVAVKESDERLRARPPENVLYEWNVPTVTKGLTLFFGVKWFDRGYFDKNRDVYKNSMHDHLFSKFGVKAESFEVQHFLAA